MLETAGKPVKIESLIKSEELANQSPHTHTQTVWILIVKPKGLKKRTHKMITEQTEGSAGRCILTCRKVVVLVEVEEEMAVFWPPSSVTDNKRTPPRGAEMFPYQWGGIASAGG